MSSLTISQNRIHELRAYSEVSMRKLPVIALAALFASQSVSTLFAQAASRGGNVTGRGQVNASAVQRALDSRAALINRVSGAARTSVGNSAAASSQTSLNASSQHRSSRVRIGTSAAQHSDHAARTLPST